MVVEEAGTYMERTYMERDCLFISWRSNKSRTRNGLQCDPANTSNNIHFGIDFNNNQTIYQQIILRHVFSL